jgi:hypothetical protein
MFRSSSKKLDSRSSFCHNRVLLVLDPQGEKPPTGLLVKLREGVSFLPLTKLDQ